MCFRCELIFQQAESTESGALLVSKQGICWFLRCNFRKHFRQNASEDERLKITLYSPIYLLFAKANAFSALGIVSLTHYCFQINHASVSRYARTAHILPYNFVPINDCCRNRSQWSRKTAPTKRDHLHSTQQTQLTPIPTHNSYQTDLQADLFKLRIFQDFW